MEANSTVATFARISRRNSSRHCPAACLWSWLCLSCVGAVYVLVGLDRGPWVIIGTP
jgi:hypothetical protein